MFLSTLFASAAEAKIYSIYCFLDKVETEYRNPYKIVPQFSEYDIWEFIINEDAKELSIGYTNFSLPNRKYFLHIREWTINGLYLKSMSSNKNKKLENPFDDTLMDNLDISRVRGIAQYVTAYKDYRKTYYLSDCSRKKPCLLYTYPSQRD